MEKTDRTWLFHSAFVTAIFPNVSRGSTAKVLTSSRRRTFAMVGATVNPARTAVVTGANGGIGRETCKGLAQSLPNLERLILCCRDMSKGEQVAQPLRKQHANRGLTVDVVPVDLADGDSVVKCAQTISSALEGVPLDLLVCNAGIMASPLSFARTTRILAGASVFANENKDNRITTQVERQYFVNHISHALLTDRLLPALRASNVPRIIFVSSLAVNISRDRDSPPLIAEKTSNTVTDGNYERWRAYGDSKLAMSLFARAVANYEGPAIESVSLHPGVVQTDLGRYITPKWVSAKFGNSNGRGLLNRFFRLFGILYPEEGAALTLELSTAERGSLANGSMYVGLGGQLASSSIIPLLDKTDEVEKLYNDTKSFIDSI